MEYNASLLESNVTLQQIASALNLNISNVTNVSDVSEKVFGIYDDYRAKEREQLHIYKSVSYVLGTLIILSNLTVVISSGLILKKGQQPKSTYLLLGNVSLADTIIGIAILFGNVAENSVSSDPLCIFQIGMIACPTMVSIFSVGLIAIDRYIYILHGLYYQRWINATRVRIGIVIIWLVGVILGGLLPAVGVVNYNRIHDRCTYASVFPRELILFNSALSLVPMLVVAILYSIILQRALKNMRDIKSENNIVSSNSPEVEKPKLRANRGNYNSNKTLPNHFSVNIHDNNVKKPAIKKCLSSDDLRTLKDKIKCDLTVKCNSIGEIRLDKLSEENETHKTNQTSLESEISIWTVETASNHSVASIGSASVKTKKPCLLKRFSHMRPKKNEPCKCRAIIVVILTTGSFLFTWVPFFIFLMKFMIICDTDHALSDRCIKFGRVLAGPVATVAYSNSILNPLIYAWWHKGFQQAVKHYIQRWCIKKYYESMFRNKSRR